MSVVERIYENGVYHQNVWTGFLGKDANDYPCRTQDGTFQYEFELKAVSFRHTWRTEESVPEDGRWAHVQHQGQEPERMIEI